MDPNDELYHYGIKGMKWGIRRTPEQLGHVTKKVGDAASSAGKAIGSAAKKAGSAISKKAAESKRNREAKKKHEEEVKKTQQNSKKKISELTNDELRDRIQRMQLENQYRSLMPQQKSKGQAFVSTIANQVIKPAATNAAKQYLEKQLKSALGLNDSGNTDPLKKLRDEVERLNLEDRKKQLTTEDPLKNLRQEAERTKLQNQMDRDRDAMDKRADERKQRADEKAAKEASDNYEVPNSNRSSSRRDVYDDVINVTNFTVEDVPITVTNAGRVYSQNVLGGMSVAGLLGSGEKRKK